MVTLRIKELLYERGLTSKELANRLGKAPQYISNVINGGKGASLSSLGEIADVLQVNIGELFANPNEASQHPSKGVNFVAFFQYGDNYQYATSINEARRILDDFENDK